MPITDLPVQIQSDYEVYEFRHAVSILKNDFPGEYKEIIDCLAAFKLKKSQILTPGGRKSPIANELDGFLYSKGWKEHHFDTAIEIDGKRLITPTHSIDCYKNRIALDIEWNNKDPFYDRDLNNFRLLFDRGAISIGVIITRCSNLQTIFNSLGKGDSYGTSTTHIGKLIPRVQGGSGGGCPLLVFGITAHLYDPNA